MGKKNLGEYILHMLVCMTIIDVCLKAVCLKLLVTGYYRLILLCMFCVEHFVLYV